MRFFTPLLFLLLLAACTFESARPLSKPLASVKCATVAQQRMRDSEANGYDQAAQKTSFDYTYNDCVQWDAAHSSASQP